MYTKQTLMLLVNRVNIHPQKWLPGLIFPLNPPDPATSTPACPLPAPTSRARALSGGQAPRELEAPTPTCSEAVRAQGNLVVCLGAPQGSPHQLGGGVAGSSQIIL